MGKAVTVNSKAVTTTTTNTVGDIGLTGSHAIELAAASQAGAAQIAEVAFTTARDLFQQVGNNYQQLIGGASEIVRTASGAGVGAGGGIGAGALDAVKGAADRLGVPVEVLAIGAGVGLYFLWSAIR